MRAAEPNPVRGCPEDVVVIPRGRLGKLAAERVGDAIGRLLDRRAVNGGARVRVTTHNRDYGPMLVQVNLQVVGTPARVQSTTSGPGHLEPALARLERQIDRMSAPWRPRPWPDRTRPMLTPGADAAITRRKACVLRRGAPTRAVAEMDAMDYDVHLFTDAETGEDAVVYRAGPSGLRLARQRRMQPPTHSTPSPIIVNPHPTPTLTEGAAVNRLRSHGLPFLFFTDAVTRRGRLLYPRYDGGLTMITPVGENPGAAS